MKCSICLTELNYIVFRGKRFVNASKWNGLRVLYFDYSEKKKIVSRGKLNELGIGSRDEWGKCHEYNIIYELFLTKRVTKLVPEKSRKIFKTVSSWNLNGDHTILYDDNIEW